MPIGRKLSDYPNHMKKIIMEELRKKWIPDFKVLFSKESIEVLPDLLLELLEGRKKIFAELLETPKEKISFEIFEDENFLNYLFMLLNHYEWVNSSDVLRKIIDDFRPAYMDFSNEVEFSKPYYEMFIHFRDNCTLDVEQKRIIDLTIRNFEQSWIHLPEDKQSRLKEINQSMAKLGFDFSNNVLDSEKEFEYFFGTDEFLKEMPEDDLSVAKEKAIAEWKAWYRFTSDITSYMAVMKFCSSSEIRKHFYTCRNTKATSGKYDNRPMILEILKLRKEESILLWHKNYAENSLVDKMAESPEKVIELLEQIRERAIGKWESDLQEIRDYFSLESFWPWDLAYYSRILKEKKYEVDEKEVKKYFEYDTVKKWLFDIAERLYSITFEEIDAPKFDPEIRIYKAFRDWEFKSYFIMDMFYRKEKTSWAWADCLREKLKIESADNDPIILNVCSFQRWTDGKALLNLWNVQTMFHEFWHWLHVMLSESKHSWLNGFHVEWDFVELPSQIMENWCNEKESLKTFAKHIDTGEVITDELLEKLDKLQHFMTWVWALAQNQYWMLDMKLHTEEPPETIEELDDKVFNIFQDISLFTLEKESTKVHASFTHIFGWGYAAWYYSYLWAEIIEADVFSEFKKNGIFNPEVWNRFYSTILSQWARKPARELFHDFMWRDIELDAYFKKQGF
ncbi:MAG: Oligopeptidase A [uncultured bacterium (gcode 4)]|uniref:Oligopeptidase A n=1 Tax=uncultured bacterium (gcode 4) TaxID=1234023 RepID=K2GF68_9BACT|nr:MAG: Oligopeptidase A [uncultured bacterium (gcode 4)]